MKMTPEQKAFFEYGKAIANLSFARDFLRLNSWELEKYEDTVSRKEEVCRRTCGQCAHFSPEEWGLGKDGCLKRHCGVKSDRCAAGCLYWELRKEVE